MTSKRSERFTKAFSESLKACGKEVHLYGACIKNALPESQQQFDLKEEILSGDPSRQSRALLAVLGLLSAGREVGPYISLICQSILGNANVIPTSRCTAYDVVAAAMPSDGDCVRIAAAIVADLQKGTPPELRVKALFAVNLLPSHRLLALLTQEPVRERFSAVLRSPVPSVRSAAIETIIGWLTGDAVPAAAYYKHEDSSNAAPSSGNKENAAAIHDVMLEGVLAAAEGLTDDDSTVVAASCRAMSALFEFAATAAAEHNAKLDNDMGIDGGPVANSEHARASAVRADMGFAAVAAMDEGFAVALSRFHALPSTLQSETPDVLAWYIKAMHGRSGTKSLDALPGEAAGTRSYAFEESAAFLAELVRGGDPPAVLAAAQALFELAELDAASATLQALLPSAISAAIGAAGATSGHQRSVAQHAVLKLLLRHLDVLPSVQRAALFSRLPPMIAAMPAAGDRVNAFYLLWSAVASFDWESPATAQATRPGATKAPVSTAQLQQMLLDPHIKEAISGASAGDAAASPAGPPPHARYREPIFREEMVGSLLYMLLTHPRPAGVTGDGVTAASSAVAQASAVQAAAAAVDWLFTAKLALQGTKACLGWDRMAGVPTTGSTAAADLWLQLLLRCIQLSGALKSKLGPHSASVAAANAAQQDESAAIDPGTAALAALVRRAHELDGETQGMLLQIAANWRALHPMVRPRAVWLCACHLHLRNVVDAAWTSLADAVHGLLADARAGEVGGVASYMAAVAQGKLKLHESATSTSGRHEAGVAAGIGEAEEVALLSLERLAGLVASNHKGKLVGHLSAVAGMLEKLASVQIGLSFSPSAVERLTRVGELLKPVSTAGKKSNEGVKDATATGDGSAPTTVVMELLPEHSKGGDSLAPASYPSTLPTAAALFSAPESTRYRKFLEQLQAAALAKSVAAGGGAAAVAAAARGHFSSAGPSSGPSGGLPTLQQLTEALEGTDMFSQNASHAIEVTGSAAPVTLSLSHSVDPGAGSIRLHCSATNRTMQPLSGVVVTLLLGGPIAGSNRRPMSFKLSTLPAGECSKWEVPLRVSGFGWPLIQPAVTLPAEVPSGQPTLRCRPYAISPLQLLAPPARAMSPAEFYQRWQAMPHRTCVAAAPAEPGPLGVQRVLAAIEAAGLSCVMKAVVPVAGGVHAAFHGAAWSGESIAVVVTSSSSGAGGGSSAAPMASLASAASSASLHLHFGSEASEVVAHVRGHEAELLSQLTAGAAVPAVSAVADAGDSSTAAAQQAAPEEERRAPVSTFSFLRSVTLQMETGRGIGEDEDEDAAEKEAAMEKETAALQSAALAHWEKVHALRVAM